MAGIYLHIPFCRTRCIYCDFYSTTRIERRDRYVKALCKELQDRKEYIFGQPVQTIYFGGGTPSQLSKDNLTEIFDTIDRVYGLGDAEEITLEANPDDLTDTYLHQISLLPVNRLSIGVQTFDEDMLRLLNRRHTSAQAMAAVKEARLHGLDNISIDFMYGLPGQTMDQWRKDLELAFALDVEHISAYHLTYEENTVLYNLLKNNQVKEADEEQSVLFFTRLKDDMQKRGYEHYEISNFCKPGKYSMHNSSYWKGIHYLGCGASAHSYNGKSREWNTAGIELYMQGIESGTRSYETESLDKNTRYNDYIITSLRTKWGISIHTLHADMGEEYVNYCLRMASKYLIHGDMERIADHLILSKQGMLISDAIMRDLLYIAD